MAIAFFTVYRVYNWEFNSRKEIKVILPTGDGPFLNPLIYYMNIAKKGTKFHVFGKIAFFWSKNAFYSKTKVVPKTLSYCKTDEKFCFSKLLFRGGLRGLKIGKKAKNDLIREPLTPPKNILFFKIYFLICFTIAQSFWNNFCF